MESGVTRISEIFKWYLPKIKLTTDTEENAALPFLDILVTVRFDVMLWHTTHRKPTNTDLYFHAKSEHYPAQTGHISHTSLMNSYALFCRKPQRRAATPQANLLAQRIMRVILDDSYNKNWNQSWKTKSSQVQPWYHFIVPWPIKSENFWRNIKRMVHIPKRKIIQMLRSAMDGLELKFPGIYRIPCECWKVNVERVVGLSRRGARNTS